MVSIARNDNYRAITKTRQITDHCYMSKGANVAITSRNALKKSIKEKSS